MVSDGGRDCQEVFTYLRSSLTAPLEELKKAIQGNKNTDELIEKVEDIERFVMGA